MINSNKITPNIIWEDKGIIIGIFLHLIKHHHNLTSSTIIINNDIYKSIIKYFFTQLKFKKKVKSKYHHSHFINVKAHNINGLHINNINNFTTIHNKKITLLPWYDPDNPIIMFTQSNDIGDIEHIKDDIHYFEEHIRHLSYGRSNKDRNKCVVDIWDTYYELKVLNKYVKLYDHLGLDTLMVNTYINDVLTSPNCATVRVPYWISLPPTKEIVPFIVSVKQKQKDCTINTDLVNVMSNKIKTVNDILDDKLKLSR